MSNSGSVRILSPEEIAAQRAAEAPRLRLPQVQSVFNDRALRLRLLAAGHAMRDFLIFMADLCDAQHRALQQPRDVPVPDRDALVTAVQGQLPPLTVAEVLPANAWQAELATILDDLDARTAPEAAHQAMRALRSADTATLHKQASLLLSEQTLGLDMAGAAFIAAALQVHWVRLVTQTHAAHPDLAFAMLQDLAHCPCCGSRPTASLVRVGADDSGMRYLHCALCQTQWHRVRIQCARCGAGGKISYQQLEAQTRVALPATSPAAGAVRAECCDDCGHYLKIMAMDKDLHVEPGADDLASAALDILLDQAGIQRHGMNLLLLFGDNDAPTEPA
jgi:FdhE protein